MNATVEDLSPTIIPKSDQLNSEQLLGGPITVTVSSVQVSDSAEQPLIVHYHGENGRPYKPSKTQRKMLLFAWGANGHEWVGRSMTLFNDPTIKFGSMAVGGIRISHMSDIPKDISVSLTATKGKKELHKVLRLASVAPPAPAATLDDVLAEIAAATGKAGMDKAKQMAGLLADPADVDHALIAYKARLAAIKAASAPAPAAETTTPTGYEDPPFD